MIKRICLFAVLAMVFVTGANAQNYCQGLKNPLNFGLYNNDTLGKYTGQVGTKPSNLDADCEKSQTGLRLTTEVPNGSLANTTDNGSSSYCGQTLEPSKEFRIMQASEGYDPLAGNNPRLPVVPPGFTHSIRVGNCQTQAHAEALYYQMKITPKNALLFFTYAIVAQAPGHGLLSDPAFMIRVATWNGNEWEPISASLCYTVSTTLTTYTGTNGPGTVADGVDGWHANGSVYHKEWTPVVVDLSQYLYQNVRIEIFMSDCGASGHYGYCYVAGYCQSLDMKSTGCVPGSTLVLDSMKAPAGLNNYTWYRSKTGVLSGRYRTLDVNYDSITSGPDSALAILPTYFTNSNTRTALTRNTFMCKVTSYMNPNYPITTKLYTDLGYSKPASRIVTIPNGDGSVTLKDASVAWYTGGKPEKEVDTSATQWSFYRGGSATGTPIFTHTGGTVTYQFDTTGYHAVKVRTSTFEHDRSGNRTCWVEKTIQVRSRTDAGIDDLIAEGRLKVYPNPVGQGESLHITKSADMEGDVTCMIYDLEGRLHHSFKVTGSQKDEPINLASGVYAMYIYDANGSRSIMKLVIM